MQTKGSQISEMLDQVKDAPRQLGEKIDDLKQSTGGQKLMEADARVGRYVATLKSLIWFAAGIPVLLIAYLLTLATEGTTETVVITVAAVVMTGLIWMGVSCIRSAGTASEFLIDELQDRARPARWTLRLLKSITGFSGSKTDQQLPD